MSYYKGNNLFDDKHLHAYVENGEKYVKVGDGFKRVKIEDGTTKYNYELLLRAKEIYHNYSCLIRFDFCLKSILSSYDGTYCDIRNLWNLITAQSGTRHFLAVLMNRLKTTKVNVNSVYKAVKKDLDATEERYARNLKLLYTMLEEYGLKDYVTFIEETTGKTIFEDIFDFYSQHRLDVEDLENKAEKCETLDKLYIEHMFQICEENHFSKGNISDIIKIHIEATKLAEKKLKEEKRQEKINVLNEKRKEIAELTDIELNNAVRNGDTKKYGENILATLVSKLNLLGNKGYYIICVKRDVPYFMHQNGNEATGIRDAILFADRNLANRYLEKYKKEDEYYSVCALSSSDKRTKRAFSVVAKLNTPSHLAYWLNETINQRPSEIVISEKLLSSLKQDLRNGREYVLINDKKEYYGNYINTFSAKATQIKLLTKEDADKWISKDGTLKAYKMNFDNVATDNLIDKVFDKYDNRNFLRGILFARCFNEHKKHGYYVVVYDIRKDMIYFIGENNTLIESSKHLHIYEERPVITLDEQKYLYRIVELEDYTDKYNKIEKSFNDTLAKFHTSVENKNRYILLRCDRLEKSFNVRIMGKNEKFYTDILGNSLKTFDTENEAESYRQTRINEDFPSCNFLYRVKKL